MPPAGHLLRVPSSATLGSVCLPISFLPGMRIVHSAPEPAQPQAQWSEDKDKSQATCIHHSCTACSSDSGGHLGKECRELGRGRDGGWTPSSPITRLGAPWGVSCVPSVRLGVLWQQGLSLPHQVKHCLSAGIFYSPSPGCEERQTVPTVVGRWPCHSGLCTASAMPQSKGLVASSLCFAQVFFPKNSHRSINNFIFPSSFPF